MNNLQVALQILPPQQEQQQHCIVKVSENQVILSDIPNAPIFPFSHVFELNTEQHDEFLFDSFPHLTISQLVQGNDASIVIYDASSNSRFDTLLLLEALANSLFSQELEEEDDYEVYIQFTEYQLQNEARGKDLIGRGASEYIVDITDTIQNYYQCGLDQRSDRAASIFSIILKQKAYKSQFNILDISGCNQSILDLFAELCISSYRDYSPTTSTKSKKNLVPPMFKALENSSFLVLIACVSHSDDTSRLEHALSYTSNIYEKTSYRSDNFKRSSSLAASLTRHKSINTENDDTEYLRRIISKLTNEVNTLRHHRNRVLSTSSASTSLSDARHASIFSSISSSTSMTIPEDHYHRDRDRGGGVGPEEKVVIADLNRQIEELENQITVTRERNTHVERDLRTNNEIQDKQSQIIDGLECKLNEMEQINHDLYHKITQETENNANIEKEFQVIQRGIEYLGGGRHQLDQVLHVVENMVWKADQKNAQALHEMTTIKSQFEQELNKKDEEIEELTHQLRHNSSNKIMMLDSSAHSSDIVLPRTLALESRIEELDAYIEHIREQRDHYSDQLEERIDEADKLQHSFVMQAAKATNLEKKLADLEQELTFHRKMIRQGDISGLVKKLENEIQRLEQEKLADEQDFVTSYEDALNEIKLLQQKMCQQEEKVGKLNDQLDETTNAYIQKEEELLDLQGQFNTVQKLNLEIKNKMEKSLVASHQQDSSQRKLSIISSVSSSLMMMRKQQQRSSEMDKQSLLTNYQPFDKNELLKWAQKRMDSGGRIEIIQKFAQMSDENAQLALWVGDLEGQILSERHHLTQEAKTLEYDVMNFTVINNQLERELEQLNRTASTGQGNTAQSLPSRSAARNTSRGSASLPKSIMHNNNTDPLDKRVSAATSIHSDFSGTTKWNRSTTPNLPPPTEPPSNPLPPLPVLSYTPNNNSTSPLPPSQQKIIQSPVRNSSRISTASSVDHYDHVLRSHKLKINVAENDLKAHQQVIHKLESQLALSEAKIQEQRQEIEGLLDEQEALQTLKNKMAMTSLELKNERALKLKAEKTHLILEKRLEDLLNNKKNKYRCF